MLNDIDFPKSFSALAQARPLRNEPDWSSRKEYYYSDYHYDYSTASWTMSWAIQTELASMDPVWWLLLISWIDLITNFKCLLTSLEFLSNTWIWKAILILLDLFQIWKEFISTLQVAILDLDPRHLICTDAGVTKRTQALACDLVRSFDHGYLRFNRLL